jgi:VanZ family protein
MKRFRQHIIVASVALIILFLSLKDTGGMGRTLYNYFRHTDKLVHLFMYLVLTFTALYQYHLESSRMRIMMLVVLSAFGYGFLMEVLQYLFTTTRGFEIFDVIANLTGALIGLLLFLIVRPSRYDKSE